jgi:hypothetical protein
MRARLLSLQHGSIASHLSGRSVYAWSVVIAFCCPLALASCGVSQSPAYALPSGGATDEGICPARPVRVVTQCGCRPDEAHLDFRLRALEFNENTRSNIKRCASTALDVRVAGAPLAEGSLIGCIEQSITLDPAMRETVITLAKEAEAHATPSELATWNACNARELGVSAPTGKAAYTGET